MLVVHGVRIWVALTFCPMIVTPRSNCTLSGCDGLTVIMMPDRLIGGVAPVIQFTAATLSACRCLSGRKIIMRQRRKCGQLSRQQSFTVEFIRGGLELNPIRPCFHRMKILYKYYPLFLVFNGYIMGSIYRPRSRCYCNIIVLK